jgi:hypothetical protein
MKDSTWKKKLKRIMTEAEMPFYPDAPMETPSVPVNVDVEALKSLLQWAVGSSPEQVDRAVNKVQDLAASGAVIDANSISDITVAGDFEMPSAGVIPPVEPAAPAMPPVEAPEMPAPVSAPMDEPLDIAAPEDPDGVEPITPEEEPVDLEAEPVDDEVLDVPAADGDIEEPITPEGEEEEDFEEEVKKTFFKSFFS